MKNTHLILFLVSLWDTCNCVVNYTVAREGKNVSLFFNITLKTKTDSFFIKKNGTNIFMLRDEYPPKHFNSSYGQRIQYDGKQRRTAGGSFSFTLLNATASDAGLFECMIGDEQKPKECLLLVISREPTQPEVEGDSESLVAGSEVTLTCKSTSRSLPSDHPLVMNYIWKKNDVEQQLKLQNYILNISKADRGCNYTCQAYEEGLGSPWSPAFTVLPQYGPDSIEIFPTSVLEGGNVTCTADCNPGCNITWSGRDGQVNTGQVGFRMKRDQSWTKCTAWNELGNWSTSVNVNVLFPPALSCEDGNKTVREDGSLALTWLVNSNPEPKVTIHSPNGTGTPMTTPEDIHDNNYKIFYTIDSAKCDDHSHYEITAENHYGSTHLSVAVVVLCSPRLFPKPKPVTTPDDNTWSFMIQAYPEPTLEAIFFMSPGGDTKAISLPHKHIPNERQTEGGLTTRSNLHEFHVNFPCESLGEKYLLAFINTEGKRNISFSLEDDHCKAQADATLEITIVIITIILVLINLTTGLVIYRRRKRAVG